jgi:5-methylcytosine-specific restriction endonuclease McrA
MPPRKCLLCTELAIAGTSRCPAHSRGWRKSPQMLARADHYRSRSWRERSKRQLEAQPLCECKGCSFCGSGCGRRAGVSDHVNPIGLGGDPAGPLQSLCTPCHLRKSSSEGGRAAKQNRRRRDG